MQAPTKKDASYKAKNMTVKELKKELERVDENLELCSERDKLSFTETLISISIRPTINDVGEYAAELKIIPKQ